MPFRVYRTAVREDWLDYNGHMNDAAYAIVCGEASEALLDALGLGAAYHAATGCTTYTVESHIWYKREAKGGTLLHAETVVVAADPKRLRVRHRILDEAEAEIAVAEYVYLHVNQHTGRVEPMPDGRWQAVQPYLAT
jgi:acyl-CoA thioester hydrolase